MKALTIMPLMALALAGCGEEKTAQERAAENAAAVAEVEKYQEAPPEMLAPQPILYPDIEKHGLFGAGCNFLPEGGGMGAVFLGMADGAAMKKGGEILRFAADKGSRNNPLGSWRKYDGKDYSAELEIGQGQGEQVGSETVNFPARLVVRDGKDRVVYESAGTAQCGS